ncbi:MAG TPA: hypothetical protein VGM31_01290 [Puia sp.]|jgi:cytochrome c biogenesis protein CcdA
METNEISLFDLQVDHESTIYFNETAKWARFLAILGFVWCGFFVLGGIGIMMSKLASATTAYGEGFAVGMGVAYIAMAIVYFFPCMYALNFARRMQTALRNNDQLQLNESLRNLKSTFRYLGITAIIGLCLVVVLIMYNLFS